MRDERAVLNYQGSLPVPVLFNRLNVVALKDTEALRFDLKCLDLNMDYHILFSPPRCYPNTEAGRK